MRRICLRSKIRVTKIHNFENVLTNNFSWDSSNLAVMLTNLQPPWGHELAYDLDLLENIVRLF